MKFRRTLKTDILDVMIIINQAQEYLKSQNIDQWQNNYPNEETIASDIDLGYGYVLTEGTKIIATSAISFDGEPTYDKIYEGQWLSDFDYAVIHRIAVNSDLKGKGLSSLILDETERLCKDKSIRSIKVDTHEQNTSMQRLLIKNGFTKCGLILLKDGSRRIAFEKLLF